MHVWSDETPGLLQTLNCQSDGVSGLVVHQDGRRVLAACEVRKSDNKLNVSDIDPKFPDIKPNIIVWDLEKETILQTLDYDEGSVSKMMVHPDGRRVFAVYRPYSKPVKHIRSKPMRHIRREHAVDVWDIERGELLHILPIEKVIHPDDPQIKLHPDGRRIVTSQRLSGLPSPMMVKVMDIDNGDTLHTFHVVNSIINDFNIPCFGLLKQGDWIYLVDDYHLYVRDVETGGLVYQYTADHKIASVVAVDDTNFVIGGASGQVHFLRIGSGPANHNNGGT